MCDICNYVDPRCAEVISVVDGKDVIFDDEYISRGKSKMQMNALRDFLKQDDIYVIEKNNHDCGFKALGSAFIYNVDVYNKLLENNHNIQFIESLVNEIYETESINYYENYVHILYNVIHSVAIECLSNFKDTDTGIRRGSRLKSKIEPIIDPKNTIKYNLNSSKYPFITRYLTYLTALGIRTFLLSTKYYYNLFCELDRITNVKITRGYYDSRLHISIDTYSFPIQPPVKYVDFDETKCEIIFEDIKKILNIHTYDEWYNMCDKIQQLIHTQGENTKYESKKAEPLLLKNNYGDIVPKANHEFANEMRNIYLNMNTSYKTCSESEKEEYYKCEKERFLKDFKSMYEFITYDKYLNYKDYIMELLRDNFFFAHPMSERNSFLYQTFGTLLLESANPTNILGLILINRLAGYHNYYSFMDRLDRYYKYNDQYGDRYSYGSGISYLYRKYNPELIKFNPVLNYSYLLIPSVMKSIGTFLNLKILFIDDVKKLETKEYYDVIFLAYNLYSISKIEETHQAYKKIPNSKIFNYNYNGGSLPTKLTYKLQTENGYKLSSMIKHDDRHAYTIINNYDSKYTYYCDDYNLPNMPINRIVNVKHYSDDNNFYKLNIEKLNDYRVSNYNQNHKNPCVSFRESPIVIQSDGKPLSSLDFYEEPLFVLMLYTTNKKDTFIEYKKNTSSSFSIVMVIVIIMVIMIIIVMVIVLINYKRINLQ